MNCVVYKEGMMIQLEVILCKVRRAQFDLPLTDKVGRAPRLMKKQQNVRRVIIWTHFMSRKVRHFANRGAQSNFHRLKTQQTFILSIFVK